MPANASVVMRVMRASRLACLRTIRAAMRAFAARSSDFGPPSRSALQAIARNQFMLSIAIERRSSAPVKAGLSDVFRMDIVPIRASEARLSHISTWLDTTTYGVATEASPGSTLETCVGAPA